MGPRIAMLRLVAAEVRDLLVMTGEALLAGVRRFAHARIAARNGITGDYARVFFRHPRELKIHPVGLRFLVDSGIDPDLYGRRWLAVNYLGGPDFATLETNGSDIVRHDAGLVRAGVGMSIHPLPDFCFTSGSHPDDAKVIIMGTAIPDTLKAAYAGRPLEELVRHPLTDGMGLTITSIGPAGQDLESTCVALEPMDWVPLLTNV